MKLNNNQLLQHKAFINNEFVLSLSGEQFEVRNPANGNLVGYVTDCNESDTKRAIDAAHHAFVSWSKTTAKERHDLLLSWFSLILENVDDLALLMTTEQGKPLAEAKGEVLYGASFIEWFAEECRRSYGQVIPTPVASKRILTMLQPVGVVAAITPWNFPVSMITRKISPAIAAGCTVVIKPPQLTPLCALALAKLSVDAGFPKGVINVIPTTRSKEVGKILTSDKRIRKVSFTGSTETGKMLMAQSASTVKKISLELGGNAPSIVFDDADIDKAVQGVLTSKYRNAGQTCVCTNRILVQENIYDRFIEKYVEATAGLIVGDGTQPNVQIGPMISEDAVTKVEELLQDGKDKGGSVILGGNRKYSDQLFFNPTIIVNCNSKMRMHHEEIFGPVSAIFTFKSDEEAIEMANDTNYGLAAYFYSQNINRIYKVAEALEYGMIGVNEGILSHAEAPFGGIKESGIGREGGSHGLQEYTETKYLCIGIH